MGPMPGDLYLVRRSRASTAGGPWAQGQPLTVLAPFGARFPALRFSG